MSITLLNPWQFTRGDYTFVLHDENMRSFRAACHGNRIFLTTNGNLGVGSRYAQQGDNVCHIKGAPIPCILRERGIDHWTIISGNSYLLDEPVNDDTAGHETEEFHIL